MADNNPNHYPAGALIVANQDNQYSNKPNIGIPKPLDTDVINGRGGGVLRHPGNKRFRKLVQANKEFYATCSKSEKMKMSERIVETMLQAGARFLALDDETNTWFDIGEKKALEKTSQALREGRPQIRQQIFDRRGISSLPSEALDEEYYRRQVMYCQEDRQRQSQERPNGESPSKRPMLPPKTSDNGKEFGSAFGLQLLSRLSASSTTAAGFQLRTITQDPKARQHPSFAPQQGTTTGHGIHHASTVSTQSQFSSQLSERRQLDRDKARSKLNSLLGSIAKTATFAFSHKNPEKRFLNKRK